MKKLQTSKQVSQKKLCKIAKCLGAIRIAKGCYKYEKIIYSNRNLINALNIKVYDDNYGFDRALIHKQQLYYSCGVYGNSGQLHYITYINDYGKECSCFVYYTDIDYNNDYR